MSLSENSVLAYCYGWRWTGNRSGMGQKIPTLETHKGAAPQSLKPDAL